MATLEEKLRALGLIREDGPVPVSSAPTEQEGLDISSPADTPTYSGLDISEDVIPNVAGGTDNVGAALRQVGGAPELFRGPPEPTFVGPEPGPSPMGPEGPTWDPSGLSPSQEFAFQKERITGVPSRSRQDPGITRFEEDILDSSGNVIKKPFVGPTEDTTPPPAGDRQGQLQQAQQQAILSAKQQAQKDADDYLSRAQQAMDDAEKDGEFDSGRWFKKLNLGAKIATGLSLAALGLSDAMAENRGMPPRNSVGKLLDRLVSQDVQEQKENYERKMNKAKNMMNMYGVLRQKGLDERDAEELAKADAYRKAGLALNKEELSMKGEQFKENVRQRSLDRAQEARLKDEQMKLQAMLAKGSGGDEKLNRAEVQEHSKIMDKLMPAIAAKNAVSEAEKYVNKFYQRGGSSKDWQMAQAAISAALAPMAKGVGMDTGSLSDQDQERWKSVFPAAFRWDLPNTWDLQTMMQSNSPAMAKEKFRLINTLIEKSVQTNLARTSSDSVKKSVYRSYKDITSQQGQADDMEFRPAGKQ